MTRDEANELARRICSCWRTTIPRNEWADYLVGLDDAERAGQAFLRLREREAKSFREFGDTYRQLAPAPLTLVGERTPERTPRDWAQVKALLLEAGAPERLIERPKGTP